MPRLKNHDYRSPCTYHITLNKLPSVPDYSVVTGRPESWYVYHTAVGKAIEKSIGLVLNKNSGFQIYRFSIMPDHVHILLRVVRYLVDPLGIYIGKMKVLALQKAREKGCNFDSLFVRDFHDRIVWPHHCLNTVFQYVKQNPYRLLVRKFYPEHFKRLNFVFNYGGIRWEAYGNMHLLANPFKEAVVCHSRDAKYLTIRNAYLEKWLYVAANGGVLVSPFISGDEKEVRQKAEDVEGKIILLVNQPFGDRYKPGGHNFELCQDGRLVVLAPDRPLPECRRTWLFLNEIAEWISRWR